jgi:hypothetical protein
MNLPLWSQPTTPPNSRFPHGSGRRKASKLHTLSPLATLYKKRHAVWLVLPLREASQRSPVRHLTLRGPQSRNVGLPLTFSPRKEQVVQFDCVCEAWAAVHILSILLLYRPFQIVYGMRGAFDKLESELSSREQAGFA